MLTRQKELRDSDAGEQTTDAPLAVAEQPEQDLRAEAESCLPPSSLANGPSRDFIDSGQQAVALIAGRCPVTGDGQPAAVHPLGCETRNGRGQALHLTGSASASAASLD